MPNELAPLKWATSEGGPLLLVDQQYLKAWEGTELPAAGRVVEAVFRWNVEADAPATDYDRACDVDDCLGIIPIGDGQGLILGDSPDSTTWLPLNSSGGILVRWGFGDSEAAMVPHLASLPDLDWQYEQSSFPVPSGTLYLFDSAFSGDDVLTGLSNDFLIVELEPGAYQITTATYRPDESTSLRLHRLLRTASI